MAKKYYCDLCGKEIKDRIIEEFEDVSFRKIRGSVITNPEIAKKEFHKREHRYFNVTYRVMESKSTGGRMGEHFREWEEEVDICQECLGEIV